MTNIAMENGPLIDDLPINGDFPWRTVSHNQMVLPTWSAWKTPPRSGQSKMSWSCALPSGHMGGSHIQSGDPCGFISGENDENHVFSWQEIHVVKRFSMEKSQHVFFIPDIWGVQGIFLKVLTTIEIPSTWSSSCSISLAEFKIASFMVDLWWIYGDGSWVYLYSIFWRFR